jgi:16S rRNA (guanine527-N7)-methyltransferase
MSKEEFINGLKKINITLTSEQLNQLDKYYHLLIEWNEKINLTRIVDEKDVYLKHFYDSLTLSRVMDLNQELKLCDIGTGAGFPGLVLKIVFPKLQVTLVDSLLKRIKFLDIVIKELNLSGIETIHSRAEDYVKFHRNEYDIVTSRAVSRLNNLLEYSIPLVKKNGFFIPMKANCEDEINESLPILKRKNIKIDMIDEFYLPIENSKRTIIKLRVQNHSKKN